MVFANLGLRLVDMSERVVDFDDASAAERWRWPYWLERNWTIVSRVVDAENGKTICINETTLLGLLICLLRGKI